MAGRQDRRFNENISTIYSSQARVVVREGVPGMPEHRLQPRRCIGFPKTLMFILVPSWPRSDHIPLLTSTLVGVTAACFLLTWPLQQSRMSTVSHERFVDQTQALAQLLSSSDDLKPDDRILLKTEQAKEPYPSLELLSLFRKINDDPLYLSSEARYRWSQVYPLFESQQRAVTLHPGLTTPCVVFGFSPSLGWMPES